jgi:hypothetical protein
MAGLDYTLRGECLGVELVRGTCRVENVSLKPKTSASNRTYCFGRSGQAVRKRNSEFRTNCRQAYIRIEWKSVL